MLQSKKLQAEMLQTSPPSSVHDVAFPHAYSDVFAACGLGEIRIWHLHSRRELLRMSVPNLDCRCVAFMQVGPINLACRRNHHSSPLSIAVDTA